MVYSRIDKVLERMLSSWWTYRRDKYDGLLERCSPGVHQRALELLAEHAECRGPVLDLASGTGAWLARVRDSGFTDITATELDLTGFQLKGIEPLPIDLNTPFSKEFSAPFPIVTALEIVEHLSSPYSFLREVRDVMEDDGLFLLSTPNTANWLGRIIFMLTGEFRMFDDANYKWQKHVSPLSHLQMIRYLQENSFQLVSYDSAGSFHGPLKRLLLAPIWGPFALLFGRKLLGDVNIYLARKVAAPEIEETAPD